jgi:hypothetical protein
MVQKLLGFDDFRLEIRKKLRKKGFDANFSAFIADIFLADSKISQYLQPKPKNNVKILGNLCERRIMKVLFKCFIQNNYALISLITCVFRKGKNVTHFLVFFHSKTVVILKLKNLEIFC